MQSKTKRTRSKSRSSRSVETQGKHSRHHSSKSSSSSTSSKRSSIPKKISLSTELPLFKDVQASDRPVLFISKLRQCNKLVKPSDEEMRKRKVNVLYQLLDFVNTSRNRFPEIAIPDLVHSISVNIFRPMVKPVCEDAIYDPDEDEPSVDPSWCHLQFIYELLLRFVISSSVDPRVSKKFIDKPFISRILQLFMSNDPRERDYLKTILHRIYAKFMTIRSFIRAAIRDQLLIFLHGAQRHNGVPELLEIMGSIINGFALPLKDEHRIFLGKVLIPLHRVEFVSTIHPQLSYCVTQYIEKDIGLGAEVLEGILHFWPRTNSPKEVLFLQEVEEVLELTPTPQLAQVLPTVFRHIAECMCSSHFQVAEKACSMLQNEYVVTHIQELHEQRTSDMDDPICVLFRPLFVNSQHHWNPNVKASTELAMNVLMELDADSCRRTIGVLQQDIRTHRQDVITRRRAWRAVTNRARDSAGVVFTPSVVIDPHCMLLQRGLGDDSVEPEDEITSEGEPSQPSGGIFNWGSDTALFSITTDTPTPRRTARRKSLVPRSKEAKLARRELESYVPVHARNGMK
eukprot:gnl/Dysnectes_brevis/3278_a4108_1259.p1 GENE.gnl/Dysnectes_brevis/3278_a4108_1259~~gnl/Dysnectes_brevis/3278_a4108_1259.p1  ORF type:complete len:570 (+),score=212.64 gnl/Dysnectes_brevis/3278_a4108_1259:36-1745(+)